MQEVLLSKPTELTLDDVKISDQLGFIDSDGYKGHFVYVGVGGYTASDKVRKHSAVSMRPSDPNIVANMSYGAFNQNSRTKISLSGSIFTIKKLYKFNSRKELYKWLSE